MFSFLLLASLTLYRAVTVDPAGQLHITTEDGRTITPLKKSWQSGFADPKISPDKQTVGCLVESYVEAIDPQTGKHTRVDSQPIANPLILFRKGRIIQTFTADAIFWDWTFQQNGQQVAYCSGPTHGGASECLLRDTKTGRILQEWQVSQDTEPPAWAANLRF